MSPTIAEILDGHVTPELESIDRLYLNGYIPGLQSSAGQGEKSRGFAICRPSWP
jgi:hypothetical protein